MDGQTDGTDPSDLSKLQTADDALAAPLTPSMGKKFVGGGGKRTRVRPRPRPSADLTIAFHHDILSYVCLQGKQDV